MEKESKYRDQTIIFFDDDCIMCNGFVRKILKYKSSRKRIYFAPLSKLIISNKTINLPNNSIILYYLGNFHFKSTAVIRILLLTKFPIKILGFLIIIPTFFRDFIYDFIARKRYFFGKKKHCEIPDKSISEIIINHNVII